MNRFAFNVLPHRLNRLIPCSVLATVALASVGAMPMLRAQSYYATPYRFLTIAGSPGVAGSANETGTAATFNAPHAVAVDASGNLYVADTTNDTIRKVTAAGVVTTLAGSPGVAGTSDGTGANARFNSPEGIAVDGSGNIYVSDTGNNTIRKVTSAGAVTTLAGLAGAYNYGSSDGTGSNARFDGPMNMACDSSGNIFVADTGNCTIRKITPGGVVTTFAGSAGSLGSVDGTGTSARFRAPTGVAVDANRNVYVGDTLNYTVRKITPAGVVTTLAGLAGNPGSADGTGTGARFEETTAVAVDHSGNVYVADLGYGTIRMIDTNAVVTTLAGGAAAYTKGDGTGQNAYFYKPTGIAVDSSGNVYVADWSLENIRKGSLAGPAARETPYTWKTVDGTGYDFGSVDGTGTAANFNHPGLIVADSNGNLYVADQENDTIRKITRAGVVTTIAGSPGNAGSADGSALSARFNNPTGVALDSSGNLYIADYGNDTIRKMTPDGTVSTIAGVATLSGTSDGTKTGARFSGPYGLVIDGSGNIIVADKGNSSIRKVTQAGVVTTLAGLSGNYGSVDGLGSAARFHFPSAIVLDASGNFFVTDSGNNTIRKITAAGRVTTFVGSAIGESTVDDVGTAARLYDPLGLAFDHFGNLYVADATNSLVRKITPDAVVTTLGGNRDLRGSYNIYATGSNAWFETPTGMAVIGNSIYMADGVNSVIDLGTPGVDIFNGYAGLIFQNGTLIGALTLGTNFLPTNWQGIGGMGTGWQARAMADVDGDGIDDIIFQNGTLIGALILDATGAPSSWIGIGAMGAGWELRGAGDIDGDGISEWVFQNGTSLGYLSLDDDGAPIGWKGIGAVGTGWELRAVADLNSDGIPDLIFQNGTQLAALQISTNGLPTAWNGIGVIGAGWTLSDAVDLNVDGQPDLVFQDGTLIGALEINTSFLPVAWHGIGALGAGWTLPGDY